MKIKKKAENVSDDNDKDACLFRYCDIKKYVVSLKAYLHKYKNESTVWECTAISREIEGWENFFWMMEKLNIKTK